MATGVVSRWLTADEYALSPGVDGFREELLEGELVSSPMPKLAHVLILDRLTEILTRQFASADLRITRETGWKLRDESSGAESVPGPDLMVVNRNDIQRSVKADGWYEGVPLMVLEVISPSERKSRRLQKVGLYLDMGVQHVVEVDYTRRTVRIHSPQAESVAVYNQADQMETPFKCAVAEIFEVLD